jgi:hypothetical protein
VGAQTVGPDQQLAGSGIPIGEVRRHRTTMLLPSDELQTTPVAGVRQRRA